MSVKTCFDDAVDLIDMPRSITAASAGSAGSTDASSAQARPPAIDARDDARQRGGIAHIRVRERVA